ncbi:hypothetical protein P692DRAFT_20324023 [Suillus brevipes Sb2]|nr:hypothetical protein P692DRAFT_20324023 [Suillus brevipes Sb2]
MPQDGHCSIRVIEGAVTPRACTARPKSVFRSHLAYNIDDSKIPHRIAHLCNLATRTPRISRWKRV